VHHRECRRDVGARTDEDLVARPDARGSDGELERGGPAADSDPVPAADEGGERGLEVSERLAERT